MKPHQYRHVLFCVGEVQQVERQGEACVHMRCFKNERSMLIAWQQMMVQVHKFSAVII